MYSARVATTVVNTHEAKSRLSELIRLVEAGENVIVARNGEPVVRFVRLVRLDEATPARQLGSLRGEIWIADDAFSTEVDAEIADLFDDDDEPAGR